MLALVIDFGENQGISIGLRVLLGGFAEGGQQGFIIASVEEHNTLLGRAEHLSDSPFVERNNKGSLVLSHPAFKAVINCAIGDGLAEVSDDFDGSSILSKILAPVVG